MVNQNDIVTERLILKEINESHSKQIVAFRNKDNVYKYFKNPHPITLEEHNNWYFNHYLWDETRYDFVIVLRETGEIIGTCGMGGLDRNKGMMEVSYLLDTGFRGKGYAKEAVRALIEYGIRAWRIKVVSAVIHRQNIFSIRFIEKLGFSLVEEKGVFLKYEWNNE